MQANKFKILFVEDHEDTRDLLVLVLRESKYDVTSTGTVAGALALLETEKFDLFVLDSRLTAPMDTDNDGNHSHNNNRDQGENER